VRKHVDQIRWEYATRFTASIALAGVSALIAASSAMLLAAMASGSLGPGRFELVGVNVFQFGLVIFIEVLIPSFLAALIITKPYDPDKPRRK
jgi:cation transporter-like permease